MKFLLKFHKYSQVFNSLQEQKIVNLKKSITELHKFSFRVNFTKNSLQLSAFVKKVKNQKRSIKSKT